MPDKQSRGASGSVGKPRPRIHNKKLLAAIHAAVIEHSGNGELADHVVEHISADSVQDGNANQPVAPVTPRTETPVRQEEGEWSNEGIHIYCGEKFIEAGDDEAGAMAICAAHNASLRDKTEQQQLALVEEFKRNHHNPIVAQLNAQIRSLDRLAAEKEAAEPNTHVLQIALRRLFNHIENHRYQEPRHWKDHACAQCVGGETGSVFICALHFAEKVLSEHAPKSSLGSELPEADITFRETRYQKSSTSDGPGLPKAEEEDFRGT